MSRNSSWREKPDPPSSLWVSGQIDRAGSVFFASWLQQYHCRRGGGFGMGSYPPQPLWCSAVT